MFGPLHFPAASSDREINNGINISCIICDAKFDSDDDVDLFINHLRDEHTLIIKDYEEIIDLCGYAKYWKDKFSDTRYEDVCLKESFSEFQNSGNCKTEKKYFCLSKQIPGEKEIRETLMKKSLEDALAKQAVEREDTNFVRRCLFCNHDIKPTRAEYLNHLSSQHNLQLGKPNNLVYIDRFLDVIERRIESLKCIFCEKTFKDRPVLKEHMRKKLHKRVNPNNPVYDKFYMVNYLAPRNISKKSSMRKRRRSPDSDDEECDWSDWTNEEGDSFVCLFCPDSLATWDDAVSHLLSSHGFDFKKSTLELDFYQKVKMVNYIRHQIYKNYCIACKFGCDDRQNLLQHMKEENHFVKPQKECWDQPVFFFPTYENDLFLCHLDSSESNSEDEKEEKRTAPVFSSIMEKPLSCLLCDESFKTGDPLLEHMSNVHEFHYYDFTEDFTFMDRVKLINYFRLCILKLQCINCNEKTDSHKSLLDHMRGCDHYIAPSKEVWCKSEYQRLDLNGIETTDFLYALENIGSISEAQDEKEERGEYSDFEDDDIPIMCLFCKSGSTDWTSALSHMVSSHGYNFLETTKDLSFYQQVQLVNYTRQKIKMGECPVCESKPSSLLDHLNQEKHFTVPAKELWDHSKYCSSYFVGDPFLSELNVRHATDFEVPQDSSKDKENEVKESKKVKGDDEEESSDWSDWDEDMKIIVNCLFCRENYDRWAAVLDHMKGDHKFDYSTLTKGMTFYDQVKIVNFIRKQMLRKKCITCDTEESTLETIVQHMMENNHLQLPEKKLWDNNDYFTPTLENDGFLAHLDDSDSDGE